LNSQTQRQTVAGPVGNLECAVDQPAEALRGVAVICHPHPQFGGTMDNKVVQTIARACLQCGWRTVRFNFRGVGASDGEWDEGFGEVEDTIAVIDALRDPALPLLLAGFSFGGYVATQAAARQPEGRKAERVLLVAPSQSFTLATVPEDTLLIHGEQDDVVPLSASLDWARPHSLPVVVVPGGGHFFHGQLPLLKSLVVRHLTADFGR
jgi:alpha/beta superfamily hydrolase